MGKIDNVRRVESVSKINIGIDSNAKKSQQSNFPDMLEQYKQKYQETSLDDQIQIMSTQILNLITVLEYTIDMNDLELVHKISDIHLKYLEIQSRQNSEKKLANLKDLYLILNEIKKSLNVGFDRKA